MVAAEPHSGTPLIHTLEELFTESVDIQAFGVAIATDTVTERDVPPFGSGAWL